MKRDTWTMDDNDANTQRAMYNGHTIQQPHLETRTHNHTNTITPGSGGADNLNTLKQDSNTRLTTPKHCTTNKRCGRCVIPQKKLDNCVWQPVISQTGNVQWCQPMNGTTNYEHTQISFVQSMHTWKTTTLFIDTIQHGHNQHNKQTHKWCLCGRTKHTNQRLQ